MQRNDEQILIEGLIYAIIFIILLVTGLILFFFGTRKKMIEQEIEAKEKEIRHQNRIIQATITAQEKERKRIARDLHDAISSKLNLISLSTHYLLGSSKFTEEQTESIHNILDIISTTLDKSRTIAHTLLPPVLSKFGLTIALEELFDEFSLNSNLKIDQYIEDIHLDNKMFDLHIFRIIQELINNSLRHGKSSEISIKLTENVTHFTLEYSDNGLGFDTGTLTKKAGIGLENIKSRALILGGKINIESEPNKGMTFILNCNYDQ